jgi:predicted nucleic acid-binding protein
MLTDTTFWVDLARERDNRQRGPAHQFLARNRTQSLEVSIITWGELAAGVNAPEELDRLLRRVRVLMLHRQVA